MDLPLFSLPLAIARNQQWSVSALINSSRSVVERYTYAERFWQLTAPPSVQSVTTIWITDSPPEDMKPKRA